MNHTVRGRLSSAPVAFMLGCICTGAAPVALADRLFRLQPEVNSAWKLQSTSDVAIQIKLLGAKVHRYTEHETIHATISVERVDSEGSAELLLVVEKVEVSQVIDGDRDKVGEIHFDSSAPVPPQPHSKRWTDLADRSAKVIGTRRRIVLKPNGEMEAMEPSEVEKPAAVKEWTCPPSSTLELAKHLELRSLVCLPERPVPNGAVWQHDPARSDVAKPHDSGRAPVAQMLGLGKGKQARNGQSVYAGSAATDRGKVERITTLFSEDQSGLFRDLGHRMKVVGELRFDSASGALVDAKWDLVATDKGGMWLGMAGVDLELHSVVTLVPALPAVPQALPGVVPLPPVP